MPPDISNSFLKLHTSFVVFNIDAIFMDNNEKNKSSTKSLWAGGSVGGQRKMPIQPKIYLLKMLSRSNNVAENKNVLNP